MKDDIRDKETEQDIDKPFKELKQTIKGRKQLRRSEELYRTIFETAGTAIIIIDSDTTIRIANSNFEKLSGYSKQELEGKMSWTAFIANEDLGRMKACHKQRRSDRTPAPAEYEFSFVNRAGEARNILLNMAMIEGTSQSVASCMDITARKYAEESLRRSEENYRNILESIQEVYYEVDLKGNFTFFNPTAWRALGYSENELANMNFRDYMDADNIQKVFDAYHHVFLTGEPIPAIEFDAIMKNRELLPAEASVSLRRDSNGRVVGFKGVVRDITWRKEAQKARHQSEEKYRNILESIEEGYYEVDLNGKFTFFNDSLCRIFGRTREELLGLNYGSFVSEEYAQEVYKTYNTVFKTGNDLESVNWEFSRKSDGQKIFIELSVSRILSNEGRCTGFRGMVRDVTNRVKAEEDIKKNEAKYRSILQSIQEGYYEVDLTGRFTFFNDSFCAMVGYTPEEVMGTKYRVFVDEETAHKIYDVFHNVYLTGNPDKGFDWSIVRKDGTKNAIESSTTLMRGSNGEPIGFRGVMRDVTERKQAQEALRVSEERFRDLAELLPETVYEAQMDGQLTFVNKSGLEHFGYSEEDLIRGLTMRDVISSEEILRMEDNFARMLKGERTGLSEYTVVRKDKTTFPALAHSAPIMRDGNAAGIRGFLVDISEKKSLEERLLHAQRMESIGTLAGGVAHDFNNLLMGIQGNISLIGMELDEGSAMHKRLKNIEGYIKRASDLTRQLLGFARGGKYEVKVTDLADFIRRSTDMFACTRKEVRVHTLTASQAWPVEVDQTQIEQVLLNLYMNAWQAMPAGGDLYVGLENMELTESAAQAYELVPGRYVKINVRDTGIGMDEATKARIFDPFFTTKEMGRGTGLGLASVYGIVKNHDGYVGLQSEPGIGTEFFIYLPASIKHPDQDEPVQKVVKGDNNFVLLVDDEEMILDVGSAMLENLGYRVLKARGGESGLEEFAAHCAEIDLVILDMIMPDLSGKDVFTRMKEIDPKVRILLASGYSLNSQTKEILESGCEGFIQKPFSLQVLSEKIGEVLRSAAV